MFGYIKKRREKAKLYESVSAFGKLPGLSEFVKVNMGLPHAATVNNAVDHLVHSLQENQRDVLKTLSLTCVFEEEGRFQFIQMVSSHDDSGREYPFTATGYIKHPLVKECQPAVPFLLLPLLTSIECIKSSPEIASKQTFETAWHHVQSIMCAHSKASLLEAEIKALKSCQQGKWLTDIFPGKTKEEIASFVAHCSAQILSFKQGVLPHLTLPIFNKTSLECTLFWLQWIETLLKPKRWPLNYCMVNSQDASHLHVWFKQPTDIDLVSWVNKVVTTVETKSVSKGLMALLSEPEITLCDLIYCWKHEINGGINERAVSA